MRRKARRRSRVAEAKEGNTARGGAFSRLSERYVSWLRGEGLKSEMISDTCTRHTRRITPYTTIFGPCAVTHVAGARGCFFELLFVSWAFCGAWEFEGFAPFGQGEPSLAHRLPLAVQYRRVDC